MSKQYAPLAARIVELVGGTENIRSVYHCQTRLRFELKDESKVQKDTMDATDGVTTSLFSGGQYQVVVGMHVKDVYDEVEIIVPVDSNASDAPASASAKKNVVEIIIDFVAGTFQPIIPALSGAGMVKALMALLVVFGVITREDQTYVVLNFFADAVFYFLPILLAFTAANKLKCNPVLAASVAAIMLHPTWVQMVADGQPVSLFDIIPLHLTGYGNSVVPIILVILVQKYVERWLNKVVPDAVKLVFVPMLTLLVMGTLAMSVLGPIGAILSGYLASFFNMLATNAAWAPAVIIGGLLPVMVMFGLHNAVAPLGIMQMSQLGFDSIFGPGALVSNIAQGVASLVVAFRTKDKKLRQIATAGGITGLMGITEPALYGVNLPKKYPLIAAMIGGASGGLYAGLTNTHRFATGSSGLPAVLLYIGDDTLKYLVNILIALVISAVVTAVLTVILSFRFEKVDDATAASGDAPLTDLEAVPVSGGGAAAVVTAIGELTSPCAGTVVPLDQVADPVFASGAMGPGVAVEPSDGSIVAPCNGTVIVAMNTGHAFGIKTDDGVEVLVHVGIDTVAMKGVGFSGAVAKGTRVQAGQRLVQADLDEIKKAGHPATVILVVTNHAKTGAVTVTAEGSVIPGEPVLTIGN